MADYTFNVDGSEVGAVGPSETAFVTDLAFFDTTDVVTGGTNGSQQSALRFDIAAGFSLNLTGYPGITGFDRVEVLNHAATQLVIGQDYFDANAFGGTDIDVQIIETGTAIGSTLDASALDASSSLSLLGANGDDTLIGGAGGDSLYGELGDDTLDGGAGGDFMFGGDGDDTYVVDSSGDFINSFFGDAGTDEVVSSIDYVLSPGVFGLENLRLALGSGAISGTGNDLANAIRGNENANTLLGGDGNDIIDSGGGGGAGELLSGGIGDDTLLLRGSESAVFSGTLDGGAGSDTLVIEDLVDVRAATISGLESVRFAGSGSSIVGMTDTQAAGLSFAGRDGLIDRAVVHLTGTTLDYSGVIFSDMDSFSFWGTAGTDIVTGTAIRDYFRAGSGGADTLTGGFGDDQYFLDQAGVTVVEAVDGGTDSVHVSLSYTLVDNIEKLFQTGSADIQGIGNGLANVLFGNGGANDLQGLGGRDKLAGGAGNDTLSGGADIDRLYGEDGDDRLVGGDGRDGLWGGNGADTFVLLPTVADADRIYDFATGTDKLEISEALFGQDFGSGPSLDAAVFRNNATGLAQDAADRFIYNNLNGALYFDADGSGAGARVRIASLNGSPDTLAASDFVLT